MLPVLNMDGQPYGDRDEGIISTAWERILKAEVRPTERPTFKWNLDAFANLQMSRRTVEDLAVEAFGVREIQRSG